MKTVLNATMVNSNMLNPMMRLFKHLRMEVHAMDLQMGKFLSSSFSFLEVILWDPMRSYEIWIYSNGWKTIVDRWYGVLTGHSIGVFNTLYWASTSRQYRLMYLINSVSDTDCIITPSTITGPKNLQTDKSSMKIFRFSECLMVFTKNGFH